MNEYVKEINKLTESECIIESNLKYVLKVAHKYKNNGLPLEDLVQEGNIGLIKASEKFDKTRGIKFLTYATPYILKYIKAALGNNKSIVSEPGSFQHKASMVRKAQAKFKTENNTEAKTSDIAALTGFSTDVVNSTLKHNINFTVSLDKPIGDNDERTVESVLDSEISYDTPSNILNELDRLELLRSKLSMLDVRSKTAVTLRYIDELTLNECGIHLGMTPAGVSGLINRSIKKMRKTTQC